MILGQEDKPSLTELAHHGVKGMKWGVRKAYKKADKNFVKLAPEALARRNQKQLGTMLDYSKLNTRDVVVEKGSIINRTTNRLGNDGRPLYVSTNAKDAAAYRALVPTWDSDGVAKTHEGYYEVTMRATEALKAPSEKARVDAYIKLMDAPQIKLTTGEKLTGKEYLRRQGLGTIVDTLSSRELALRYYGQLAASQGITKEPLNSAYFKSLSAKGYNALVDDNDAGVYARTPMLALNPTKSLETVHVKQLTTAEVHKAQAELVLPDRSI